MFLFFLIIHIIALYLLARSVWWTIKTYSIPLTVHNFPIVLIFILGLLGAICLSLFHPWIYLAIGAPLGILQFTIESIDIPGRSDYGPVGKLLSTFSAIFLWPEIANFTLFCIWHADKIIDEEPKP